MPSSKISALTAATQIDGIDLLTLVQNNESKSILFSLIQLASALKINSTPITYTPSVSGNTNNLNEIVTDPAGVSWIISQAGDGVKFSDLLSGVFENGLAKTNGKVGLGGVLTALTTINQSNFDLFFSGNGTFNVGGNTAGGSRMNLVSGDFEVIEQGKGAVVKSPDGSRWRLVVDNNGILTTQSL